MICARVNEEGRKGRKKHSKRGMRANSMLHAPCTMHHQANNKEERMPENKNRKPKKITNVTGKMRLFLFCSDYFSTSSVHWCRWRWTWMPFFLLYPLSGGTVTLIASLFNSSFCFPSQSLSRFNSFPFL